MSAISGSTRTRTDLGAFVSLRLAVKPVYPDFERGQIRFIIAAAELDFPFTQRMRFLDLEQEPGVITDPQTVRSAYLSEFQAFRDALQNHCYQQAIDYTLVRTDSAIDTVLSRLLVERSSSKHRSETIPQKSRAAGRQSGLRSRTSPS